ncbi:peptidase M23 [Microbacterium mangrovi]|uniref:Peptidase M23 n=1 Tax=Microbacterium mangrovi TaxID=1348253 RepID=A0A0B2A7Q7_9MICO|nr:peptidase M23 [Microbacterium mangrovi]
MLLLLLSPAAAAEPATGGAATAASDASERAVWVWPTASHRVIVAYAAPATRYGPGHRGIDIAAPIGSGVAAPAAGIVAFSGRVAGRPVLTIDHGDGIVSTLEPVASDAAAGDVVRGGERVGTVAVGGHADPDTVHLGARRNGEYINPMLLLGGIPHAILLPCCA